MINLWCARRSKGGQLLADTLNGLGTPALFAQGGIPAPDAIIWGEGGASKYDELVILATAGVPVPPHSRIRHPGWLARIERHSQARDLLRSLQLGDYYVEYVPTIREHRIHVVDGRCVRVQMKVPLTPNAHPRFRSRRAGWALRLHPDYTALLPPRGREFAQQAVAALGYRFGAVDVGTTENENAIIWEVNTRPGMEGGTASCYARALIRKYVG